MFTLAKFESNLNNWLSKYFRTIVLVEILTLYNYFKLSKSNESESGVYACTFFDLKKKGRLRKKQNALPISGIIFQFSRKIIISLMNNFLFQWTIPWTIPITD